MDKMPFAKPAVTELDVVDVPSTLKVIKEVGAEGAGAAGDVGGGGLDVTPFGDGAVGAPWPPHATVRHVTTTAVVMAIRVCGGISVSKRGARVRRSELWENPRLARGSVDRLCGGYPADVLTEP